MRVSWALSKLTAADAGQTGLSTTAGIQHTMQEQELSGSIIKVVRVRECVVKSLHRDSSVLSNVASLPDR